jgi:hypothetical protein
MGIKADSRRGLSFCKTFVATAGYLSTKGKRPISADSGHFLLPLERVQRGFRGAKMRKV